MVAHGAVRLTASMAPRRLHDHLRMTKQLYLRLHTYSEARR
jgi:hypothetical protein